MKANDLKIGQIVKVNEKQAKVLKIERDIVWLQDLDNEFITWMADPNLIEFTANTNEEKIQELLNQPCWDSKPYLIGMDKVGVEDVMERFAEWKDKQHEEENHWRYEAFRSNVNSYIQRDRQETIEFVYEWLTDGTDIPEGIIENLAADMQKAYEDKNRMERRKKYGTSRDDQVKKAAEDNFHPQWKGSVIDAFREGAFWADRHPNTIPVHDGGRAYDLGYDRAINDVINRLKEESFCGWIETDEDDLIDTITKLLKNQHNE